MMVKKLTKHGNSLAVIIDKPILEMLGINEKTELKIMVDQGSLIIMPIGKKSKTKKRNVETAEIAEQIMDQYEAVFKKLAKS